MAKYSKNLEPTNPNLHEKSIRELPKDELWCNKKDLNKLFFQHLNQILIDKRWSYHELSVAIGIKPQTFNSYKQSSSSGLSLTLLVAIARTLEISLDELVNLKDLIDDENLFLKQEYEKFDSSMQNFKSENLSNNPLELALELQIINCFSSFGLHLKKLFLSSIKQFTIHQKEINNSTDVIKS